MTLSEKLALEGLKAQVIEIANQRFYEDVLQASQEIFPVPNLKKTSLQGILRERIKFLERERRIRVARISNMSEAEVIALAEKLQSDLEKKRGVVKAAPKPAQSAQPKTAPKQATQPAQPKAAPKSAQPAQPKAAPKSAQPAQPKTAPKQAQQPAPKQTQPNPVQPAQTPQPTSRLAQNLAPKPAQQPAPHPDKRGEEYLIKFE